MTNGMKQIEHVVVVMMENRSFDNMVGFLYTDRGNRPPINIPAPSLAVPTSYDGLVAASPASPYWNPSNDEFFTQGAPPVKVYASEGTTGPHPFTVPDPDPGEDFDDITFQILGPQALAKGQGASMLGFIVNYGKAIANNPEFQRALRMNPAPANGIMECYSPNQVSVITQLANSYAICDRWFCSSPTQTLPNRAFVHAGTSLGRVNNMPQPLYDTRTIYEILGDCDVSWKVYNDSLFMSLTRMQFPNLWKPELQPHFHGFDDFREDAAAGRLPAYSFVEPSFLIGPNDEHPPHDVCRGERFLQAVWQTVSSGKNWNGTLLVITYDEHGGCYDHVAPPPAKTPDLASNPGEEGFCFDRFGVRVPTLLISPFIEAGTVFRSTTGVPYDHTSILATLRDWLGIPLQKMLMSERVKAAPTFGNVLTRSTPRTDLPNITLACTPTRLTPPRFALNNLQRAILVGYAHAKGGRTIGRSAEALLRRPRRRSQ
jgi:phospholipase C